MRLIDADALKPFDYGFIEIVFMDDIREMPTIEAEPIRHGEWITVTDDVFADRHFCSACMNYAEVNLYGEEILSKYCLNCGAKMDEPIEGTYCPNC